MTEEESIAVSVVMPCFNAEAFVGRTIQSVMDQSFRDWELIVVDDCSTDATRDLVNSYKRKDSRITLITLDSNAGGPAKPRNVGVERARGAWVALLDSDDVWHPKKLEYQLRATTDCGAEFSSTGMLDFVGVPPSFEHPPTSLRMEWLSGVSQKVRNRIPTSSVLVKRKLLVKHPFVEDRRYKAVEDYHCWLRIHDDIGRSLKVNFPFLFYRRVQGQISGSKLNMLRRVYMLHREYPGAGIFKATFFTFTHALGGLYYRLLKKGL